MLLGTSAAGVGGPGRPLKCMACDLWSSSYDYWLTHLTSESHQAKVGQGQEFGHETWIEDADCCLKVTEVNDIDVQGFLKYAAKFGTIMDFVIQKDEKKIDFYFVKYDSAEPANKILAQQKRAVHQVQGRSIFFRRKYEQGVSQSSGGSGGGSDQKTGIGLLASEYWDVNDTEGNDGTALGSLQATYDDDDADHGDPADTVDEPEKQNDTEITAENGTPDEVVEQKNDDSTEHDLFSNNMIDHLANTLSSDMPIEDQLEGFCKNILLSEPFLEGRRKVVEQVLTLIKLRYPKCTMYNCGMDFVGIGNGDDPINLYVDLFDNVFSTQKQPWETNSAHHWAQVFQVLKGEADNLRLCCKLSKTEERINFEHVESGVKVCLWLTGYAAVQEAELIKFLCTLDPRVQPLLAVTRYWTSVNKIFEEMPENKENRGRLAVLLMIFHLTNRNVIPTVAKLQSQLDKASATMIYEGIDLSFCKDKSKFPPPNAMLLEDKSIMTLSAMSLLQDFLQRFGIASLKENAVSLWYGKFIKKEHLAQQNQHLLPDDFATKLIFGPDGEISQNRLNTGDSTHPFCVQDLFDPSLNLGLSIDAEEMKKFQTTAWKTGEKLERVLNSGKACLMNIFLTSAEDEEIERQRELEKQKAFQEMREQVQLEQQKLIQMKKAKEIELMEERKRQASAEAEAIRRQHLQEEEENRRRKNREEEQERQHQRNQEEEIRRKRLQVEEDDRRRRTLAQRERDEERQRLIKSEEEEQRRFVQKQQEEQRHQKQREVHERQRREAEQQLQQTHKQRLEEEQDRLERLRSNQFEHDRWKSAHQVRQGQNPAPAPHRPAFNYNNKGFGGGNGHRPAFGNSNNPNLLPLGNNMTGRSNIVAPILRTPLMNERPVAVPTRTMFNPHEDGQSRGRDYTVPRTPPEQVRRDPERSIGGSNALAAKAKSMEQDDWLNTEWEEFSKSLEQPTLNPPSSFLNMHQKRPVAPVAPSQKPILRNPHPQYFNDTSAPPPPPPPARGQPFYGGPVSGIASSVVAARGPLHYEAGKVRADYDGQNHVQSKKRRSSEFLESDSSSESSSSNSEDEEEQEEEEEKEDSDSSIQPIAENSRLRNPYPLRKMVICPLLKRFFLEAAADNDFAYGIRGKLQTLFLQFMKEFNNRFWKNCFGFEIELDPTYQDTSPADYAKFGDRKSVKMSDLLTSVPCFEENFTTTFFCQSTGKLSTLLTHATPNDLRNGKFIRKQATPMLKVLMDEVPPHLVPSSQNLRFKVEVNIILDYKNLNKDCQPYVKMVFDKGLSTQNEMLALFRFFGKLYQKMADKFLSYCLKRWLASCIDFDLKSTERKCILLKHQDIESGKTTSSKERRKLKRMKRAEKKKQKKMNEFQASSWAASTLPPRNMGGGGVGPGLEISSQMNHGNNSMPQPYGGRGVSAGIGLSGRGYDNVAPAPQAQLPPHLQFQQNQPANSQIRPLMANQQQGGSRGGRFVPGRGKTFQVPPNWTRMIGANNNSANPPRPRFPPYATNTTNNMMYRRF